MANRFLNRIMHGPKDRPPPPLGGTQFEAVQRLQVGVAGIIGMIMLVALADVIREGVAQTDATSVPEAASTVAVDEVEAPPTDPMVDAGVVPDLPSDPADIPDQDEPVLPEQGTGQAPARETE